MQIPWAATPGAHHVLLKLLFSAEVIVAFVGGFEYEKHSHNDRCPCVILTWNNWVCTHTVALRIECLILLFTVMPILVLRISSKQTMPLYDCKCGLQWHGPHPQVEENSNIYRASTDFVCFRITWYTSLIIPRYKQYGLEYYSYMLHDPCLQNPNYVFLVDLLLSLCQQSFDSPQIQGPSFNHLPPCHQDSDPWTFHKLVKSTADFCFLLLYSWDVSSNSSPPNQDNNKISYIHFETFVFGGILVDICFFIL